MLKVGVMVSGGGTNLQAILDAMDKGQLSNVEIKVVISNNPGAYALERAKSHGLKRYVCPRKIFPAGKTLKKPFWNRWIPIIWI